MSDGEPSPRPNRNRLVHFTPLRYPGGKGKLAAFVKRIIETNGLSDGEYIEPFAGSAGIALELLFHEFVSRIRINDISRPIYAFWRSVLEDTDRLCRLVHDTPLTVDAWDSQKRIFMAQQEHDDLEVGFAAFFLNRTNRSGILNGGIIGGRDQTGPSKIDARYNTNELIYRVERIAVLRARIALTREDAQQFVRAGATTWSDRALIYLDPPYYVKGRQLYYDYYCHADHVELAAEVRSSLLRQKWIVSYDNVPAIREIYEGRRYITYNIGYSARDTRQGSEVMFFCDGLNVPLIAGPLQETERVAA